jgi:hypothetical protein
MKQEEPTERVRRSSTEATNQTVDEKTLRHIRQYAYDNPGVVAKRLQELNKEWDIEKTLEVNASCVALAGLVLGTFVNKKWYLLPAVVSTFLLQHGLQGWCPPLPLFRKLGIRTTQEINEERVALKVLRGDFEHMRQAPAGELLSKIRES